MDLLAQKRSLSETRGKQLSEEYRCFPPNFKRPKIDATRQFPEGCGALAPLVHERKAQNAANYKPPTVDSTDQPSRGCGVLAPLTSEEKIEEETDVVETGKSNVVEEISVGLDKGLEQNLSLRNEELDLVEVKNDPLGASEALSTPEVSVKKYPPPRIRKGAVVLRQFPSGCRIEGPVNSSEKPLLNGKRHRDEVENGHEEEQKSEGNDSEENEGKVQVIEVETESCTRVQSQGIETEIEIENTLLSSPIPCGVISDQDKKLSDCEPIAPAPVKVTEKYENENFIQCVEVPDQCADNDEEPKESIIVEESNDLAIIPYDEHYAVASARNKVMAALNLYKETYNRLLDGFKTNGQEKSAGHVNLQAAMILKKQGKWAYNNEQFLGHVPGVEVGDQFQFRAELAIVGVHSQFMSGIEYLKKDGKIIATCIVDSGRYKNDVESSDVLVYSGQGGNSKNPEDQKLRNGNLALKNSMEEKTPVRVVRRCQILNNLGMHSDRERNAAYVYDGLYIVSRYWQEKGRNEKLVFMFQLSKIPEQPKLIQAIRKSSRKSEAREEKILADDISLGKEKTPIRVVNALDDEKPPIFTYITNIIYPTWYDLPLPSGCSCTGNCLDSKKCVCAVKNGGSIPFNESSAIIRAKCIVYGCGPSCKCPPSCNNRAGQQGVLYQLELFKTDSRGWGVRSREFVSSGRFICEYVGKLLQEEDAEGRTDNDEYLFDLGKRRLDDDESDCITIDAAQYGNVGRFINHSCSPNLYAQEVLYDHDDKKMPHIMLFASKNIRPLQELTYDYNYKIGQVKDANGNIKMKMCYCGSRKCTGRMY